MTDPRFSTEIAKIPNWRRRQHKILPIFTTRIPQEWGRYCFHRCLSVHILRGVYPYPADSRIPPSFLTGEGYNHPSWWRRVPPSQVTLGTPFIGGTPFQVRTGGTWVPSHQGQVPGQDGGRGYTNRNTACTYYTAGGIPLAFTQEDFMNKTTWLRENLVPGVRGILFGENRSNKIRRLLAFRFSFHKNWILHWLQWRINMARWKCQRNVLSFWFFIVFTFLRQSVGVTVKLSAFS